MKDFIDGYLAACRDARSETQMTLGGLITALEVMPEGARVANIGCAHSYRGYYSDLAFERKSQGTRRASALLRECKVALGKKFTGYKGGEFQMNADTPLWIAGYGCCGQKLMELRDGGAIITQPDD